MASRPEAVRVQAKKAKAELKPTEGMTMRGDAIGAKVHAVEAIDLYLETGDVEHLQMAVNWLGKHIAGTRGGSLHAEGHFKNAIRELAEVEGVEPPEGMDVDVAVVLPRPEWDAVLMVLEEDLDQLEPPADENWIGEYPGEDEVRTVSKIHESIMRQVVDDG